MNDSLRPDTDPQGGVAGQQDSSRLSPSDSARNLLILLGNVGRASLADTAAIALAFAALAQAEAAQRQAAALERIAARLDGAHNLSQLFRGE